MKKLQSRCIFDVQNGVVFQSNIVNGLNGITLKEGREDFSISRLLLIKACQYFHQEMMINKVLVPFVFMLKEQQLRETLKIALIQNSHLLIFLL